MCDNEILDKKLRYYIESLRPVQTNYVNWIQRKEVASWTAIALYLASLMYSFSFLKNNYLKYLNELQNSCLQLIIIILIIITLFLVAVIIFAFIHAQYSSIYFNASLNQALIKFVSESIQYNYKYDDLLGEAYDKYYKDRKCIYPAFIQNRIYQLQKYNNSLFGKKGRVLILIAYIVFLQWGPLGNKFNSNIMKQEASLYSLMFFANAIYIIMLCLYVYCKI
jgi:hypothetical protein